MMWGNHKKSYLYQGQNDELNERYMLADSIGIMHTR